MPGGRQVRDSNEQPVCVVQEGTPGDSPLEESSTVWVMELTWRMFHSRFRRALWRWVRRRNVSDGWMALEAVVTSGRRVGLGNCGMDPPLPRFCLSYRRECIDGSAGKRVSVWVAWAVGGWGRWIACECRTDLLRDRGS